jgi:hypothetical protein
VEQLCQPAFLNWTIEALISVVGAFVLRGYLADSAGDEKFSDQSAKQNRFDLAPDSLLFVPKYAETNSKSKWSRKI